MNRDLPVRMLLSVRRAHVLADLHKTGAGQSSTKPPTASYGGNRLVSDDFIQVQ
jgi:hypothetical protein